MLTITSPRDRGLSARLEATPDGVVVELARTTYLVRDRRITGERYVLAREVFEAPFHVVADKVHDILAGLSG